LSSLDPVSAALLHISLSMMVGCGLKVLRH
jgi:hypothetical protein